MKKLKYIIAICISWCLFLSASAQTQTLGINQSQSGNPSNNCSGCYTITVQYSISNVAATGTTIICTVPNNIFDFCSYGGATPTTIGNITTLTFNLGNQPTSANFVNYQVKFKPGVTCNGTNGILNAKISTIEHPVPLVGSPLTLTAVATEGWAITKYIANSYSQWYSNYTATNPMQYIVSICGSTVDVYYHIRISNSGCINISNASVTDNLPMGASVIGVHTGWPTAASNQIPSTTVANYVTWNVGTGNTLDVNMYAYDYYVHLQFPVAAVSLNQVLCNSATLHGTNFCTNTPKTASSASECLKLIGAYPGTSCGAFSTPYFLNYTYNYFIGCPAWLSISLAQNNQCAGTSTTTLNNIGYNAPIPVQMHVDNFNMNAIPAGKTVTITVNTTCGSSFTHSYSGSLQATTVNFYAPPFNIPSTCTITNFNITSNMSITGNAIQDFGQLYFTVLTNTWNTNAPISAGTTVTMTGAAYNTSGGTFSCTPSFVTSNKFPKIETVKDFCNYPSYYNCLNPGDIISYSIAVQNYGTGNFSGGSIRDVLPVGLEYVPNSSTFGIYPTYTKCNAANQAGTGITVAHAEATTTTNLQWNLPTLTADCNNGSNWYVINFKATVTNAAPFGLLTNHEDCYDGSNTVVAETNPYNNNASLYICTRDIPLELTKDVSADNVNWGNSISVSPGATVYYRLKVKNIGNVPISQIKLIDLLPSIGDVNVVNCNSRGSTTPIYLTSALPLGNASSISYSTNNNPVRGAYLNLIPDYTAPCATSATWSPYSPGTIQNQKAIKIEFMSPGYSLTAGQTETYYFSAQVPPGAAIGTIGWNSFAATGLKQVSGQSLGAECTKVSVNVVSTGCGCIGNFVWFDANNNGLQDAGEAGINGCTITLYDASNNPVGLPHISTFNTAAQPGYYQFCGLTAGTYHIVVTPPAGYMLTSQNTSNNALNSDINPATNASASFQFSCDDNNNLDIGLALDDGCGCDNSHWGNINISNNPVIPDDPHDFDAMPVNKMNKQTISRNQRELSSGGGAAGQITQLGRVGIPIGNFSLPLTCGKKDTITLQCKTNYSFTANYICSKPNCGSAQIVITTPGGNITTSTNVAGFYTTDGGIYTIKIYGKCGNKNCDSCEFKFRVVCPICPCDYNLAVTPGQSSQTAINTAPQYTLYNQAFNLSAPAGVLFTQVRAEVVSFDLTGGYNNECINCKNLPYTWGSIYNATDINTNAAVADNITMGLNPPVVQFTPSLSNTYQNPRETIWSNNTGFTLPGILSMQFILPPPSVIGCCTLYARMCVKFTFRDRNCKECEVISCFIATIPPPSKQIDNPIDYDTRQMSNNSGLINTNCTSCGNGSVNLNKADDKINGTLPLENSNALQIGQQVTDEELIKITEKKIQEIKKLKENGVTRGDVELLPQLEKLLADLKAKIKKPAGK